MDKRLQDRFLQLVREHMNAAQATAAGLKALPRTGQAFAATQATWRFFHNERVTLPALVEPLRELGRQELAESRSSYAMLVHDWSKMDYDGHASKRDLVRLSNEHDWGYELTTALLVDAANGDPLAPLEISVRAADGMHTTRPEAMQKRIDHLNQVTLAMEASRTWGLSKTMVHVIDREADSVKHLRTWAKGEHLFIVRANNRRVRYRGQSRLLSEIATTLQSEKAFTFTREVTLRGKPGQQFVAQTEIVLDGPGWTRLPNGKKRRVAGQPLALRLIVVQVRDRCGKLLAEWLLITNVPRDVSAEQIALWYYWRWRIESFHKLLKSAGLQLEFWQQESALAIARRLLVACMACVTIWQLERQQTPEAKACQAFLVRLSGRQMKRSRPITTPALLAGLHVLLVMLEALQNYTPEQILQFAHQIPLLRLSG